LKTLKVRKTGKVLLQDIKQYKELGQKNAPVFRTGTPKLLLEQFE
jgi:hypothetical protein